VLYRNDGNSDFTDVSYRAGIAKQSIPFLGWGVGFLDYDNDGWKDLLIINGHVYPGVDKQDWGTSYAEHPLLYRNDSGKKFDYIPPLLGTGLAEVVSGRGAAFGDLFNDGKIDAVINVEDGPPLLLRNVSPDKHHWVEMKLIGDLKSPRDAVGSTVYLVANHMRQRGDVLSGGSYISSNDQRVHFGLGDSDQVDAVEIRWPDGRLEKLQLPGVDRIYTIQERHGILASYPPTGNSSKNGKNDPPNQRK